MTVAEFYEGIGGSYEKAISRLMRDSIAEKFILKFPAEAAFDELEKAVAAEDWDVAFRASHTLKCAAVNLSLSRLSASAIALTDSLRPQNIASHTVADFHSFFEAVKADYAALADAIAKFAAERGQP